jgi:SAM-dependent methyltransferase
MMRNTAMSELELITFIKEKERLFNEHTTAKEKWLILNRLIPSLKIPQSPLIIDAGGGAVTAHIIRNWFPDSNLVTININKSSQNSLPSKYVNANIETDGVDKYFDKPVDIIFFMDVIEHLYDPDKALKNLLGILKEDGYLIISTPNLADLYNRFFLIMGYSLHNYNVSQWYKTGNPFIKDLSGKRHGNHKSVFTTTQLIELLEKIYHMEIVYSKGYSYYEPDWLSYYKEDDRMLIKKSVTTVGHQRIRTLLNKLLPNSLREGILLLAKKKY